MKKALVMLSVLTLGVGAQAQDMGRVVSVSPINQSVSVPQQVCNQQYVNQPVYNANAGNALIGAVAGGLLGSALSGGHHRGYYGPNIALGALGGAAIGSQVNSGVGYVSQPVQNCYTQNNYQNTVTGYNVVYEVAGRTYNTTTSYYPGQYINLNNTGYNNNNYNNGYNGYNNGYNGYNNGYNGYNNSNSYSTYSPPAYPQYNAPVYAAPIYRAPPVYIAPAPIYYGPRYHGGYYGGHHGRW